MEYEKHIESEARVIKYENDIHGRTVMASQHYHDIFEIYYLEYGECNYFIDDKSYEVKAGDLVLIPKGTIHKTMYGEGTHSRRLIYCSDHFIPASVVELLPSMLYLYRNPDISERIRQIFIEIEAEYTLNDAFSVDAIMDHLHLLFYLLARNREKNSSTHKNSIYTTQAISYIKKNYQSQIRLADIARQSSISPEHLSRIFKSETGFGVSEYLTMVRLQRAESILRNNSSVPISEVAYTCGFNDSNYFSDKFKRVYGVPPTKIRKK